MSCDKRKDFTTTRVFKKITSVENMRNLLCSLFILIVFIATSVIVIASESSFLDEVKEAEDHFDSRSVPLMREVTEESVLADEMYQGDHFGFWKERRRSAGTNAAAVILVNLCLREMVWN